MSKELLIKNSISGAIQLTLTAILALVSVPVFIGKLGLELYGVFAVVSVIGNLNSFANFGLNSALVVFLSKQGKCKESNYDILATLIFVLIISLVFIIVVILNKQYIVEKIFSIPSKYLYEASSLLISLIFANSIIILGNIFTAILDSQQKVYLTNLCQFVYSILYWGGIIFIVTTNGNLCKIGYSLLFASIIWFSIVLTFSLRSWGNIYSEGLFNVFWKRLSKQLKYGGKIYLSGLAAFLFEPLSKLLLANYIGINSTGLFDIGIRVRSQFNGLISKILYPLFPYIANSSINTVLKYKLVDVSKLIQILIIPISILCFFTLPDLTKLWLGNEYNKEVSIFVTTMTVSMLLFSPSVVPIYHFLLAKNHPEKTFYIQLSSAITNIISFFILYKTVGIYTILYSNAFGYISSFIMCKFYQYKFLYTDSSTVIINSYTKQLIAFIIIAIPCYLFNLIAPNNLFNLLIYPLIIYSLFILINKIFKFIDGHTVGNYLNKNNKLNKVLSYLLFIK